MVMAKIYALVGEYDLAIDELEYAMSLEGWATPAILKADPIFAPLQDIPRFRALLRQHET
jgi:hypothetical protein